MAYNVASGILRGIGDSRTPLYFLILSSGLNIFLDIFLIVVVKLGTAGAAYATVISQAVSAVLCFIVMFRKYDILRTTREDYYCDFHEIRRMLSVGCLLYTSNISMARSRACFLSLSVWSRIASVSYTHLDVYKRQQHGLR